MSVLKSRLHFKILAILLLTAIDLSYEKSIEDIKTQINSEIIKVDEWLCNNKLVLNIKKTNFIVFTNNHVNRNAIKVTLKNNTIQRATNLKFLGVIIDEKLLWNEHVGVMCNRLAKNVGILHKLKFLPSDVLLLLYNTLCAPHIQYCITSWFNTSKQNIDRIFKLQKRAVRNISHSSYYSHTAPIFSHLGILNVHDTNLFQTAIFMYLCFNKFLPTSMQEHFHLNNSLHNYQTRNALNFHFPIIRTTSFKKSIFVLGPVVWNNIPNNIRESPSINIFKRKCKHFILESSNYNPQIVNFISI